MVVILEEEPENNDIQASLDPASLIVREGESGEISCTAFTSRQSIDIEWYNDKDEVNLNSIILIAGSIFQSPTADKARCLGRFIQLHIDYISTAYYKLNSENLIC